MRAKEILNLLNEGNKRILRKLNEVSRDPFEMTEEISRFIEEYDLIDDIEPVGDAPYPELGVGKEYRLKSEVASELKSTLEAFTMEEANTKIEAWRRNEERKLRKLLAEHFPEEEWPKISVSVEVPDEISYLYWGAKIVFSHPKVEEDGVYEPEGYYFRLDPDSLIQEAAENWAAWLGIEDSPFYSESFVDGYIYDQISNWLSEAGSFEDEIDEVIKAAERFMDSVPLKYWPLKYEEVKISDKDDWIEILKDIGAPTRPKRGKEGWLWEGKKLLIIAEYDPITGESFSGEKDRENYLGKVLIRGDADEVERVAEFFETYFRIS